MDSAWSLAELSEKSGVASRTIRYYISRGLLDGPRTSGREASYDSGHLERLQAIASLQAEGLTLQQIGVHLSGSSRIALAPPVAVLRYSLGADVCVEVPAGLPPWRMRTILEALSVFGASIATE